MQESRRSSERGRKKNSWGRGRGQGRGLAKSSGDEGEFKPHRDKSHVRCYNCQRNGHFAKECYNPKKEWLKSNNFDKVNISEEEATEISLLMAR